MRTKTETKTTTTIASNGPTIPKRSYRRDHLSVTGPSRRTPPLPPAAWSSLVAAVGAVAVPLAVDDSPVPRTDDRWPSLHCGYQLRAYLSATCEHER